MAEVMLFLEVWQVVLLFFIFMFMPKDFFRKR